VWKRRAPNHDGLGDTREQRATELGVIDPLHRRCTGGLVTSAEPPGTTKATSHKHHLPVIVRPKSAHASMARLLPTKTTHRHDRTGRRARDQNRRPP